MTSKPRTPSPEEPAEKMFKPREALISRINSLKKAVRAVIKTTETGKEARGVGFGVVLRQAGVSSIT